MYTPPTKRSMALPTSDEVFPRLPVAPAAHRERTESNDHLQLKSPAPTSLPTAKDGAPFMPVFEEEIINGGVAEERRSIRPRLPLVAQIIRPQFLFSPIATSGPRQHNDPNGRANGERSRSPEADNKSSNSGKAKAAFSSIRWVKASSSDSLPLFPCIKDAIDDPAPAGCKRPLLRMRRKSCQGGSEPGTMPSSLHSSWVTQRAFESV